MSNTDQRSDAVATHAVAALAADIVAVLTNLHVQIAGLEGDAQAMQAIGRSITNLIECAQRTDALVKAANQSAPLPDETAVPAPMETPETPAVPPKKNRGGRRASADVEAGPGAETPDASADPAASGPEA